MEARPSKTLDDPTAVVPRPPWVLLDRLGHREDQADADAATVASSRTSTGTVISVSFRFAAPPATSRLYLRWPSGPSREDSSFAYPRVVAAHDDSVLLQLTVSSRSIDYFLYKARGARPPSLSLLPRSALTRKGIGILRRRGEGAFAVAELRTAGGDGTPVAFDLCVLLSPGPGPSESDKWEVRRVKVLDGRGKDLALQCWETDAVVPVGGRFLCWVDYYRGILVGRVFADGGSALTYVPLPVDTPWAKPDHGQECPEASRSVCVTAGDTVKFVSVDRGLLFVFTVTIWTLGKARDGSMEWEKDGEFRAAELWAFSGYEHLPRVPPEYPVVSMADPDALCFMVSEGRHGHAGVEAGGDDTVWLVEVDTRRRAVRSVSRFSKEETRDMSGRASLNMFHGHAFLPSEVTTYVHEQ
ncbi:hypothetical protein CFC21_060877 [Triticum aestivum]|uniref:DUF1618 domain-containing protein n=3 Tax=Triticinae TaxID=1648030 RepID=A0A453HHS4_AEGTS|nr:uncharacterized protein LOC109733422 [Aegilops tauschii subsp. strangulata]XP_044377677.1 uncharacterized protein LOC123099623 [Triticum aestivum]KAF7052850.1 hypothetical protein CFC21_060877 [Triticum aestivum]